MTMLFGIPRLGSTLYDDPEGSNSVAYTPPYSFPPTGSKCNMTDHVHGGVMKVWTNGVSYTYMTRNYKSGTIRFNYPARCRIKLYYTDNHTMQRGSMYYDEVISQFNVTMPLIISTDSGTYYNNARAMGYKGRAGTILIVNYISIQQLQPRC